MAMNTSDNESMMSEINVTPLVDVMLVLLTIFIVTAPLLTHSVPVNLPKSTTELSTSKIDAINISITKDGTIHLNNDTVLPDELDMLLEQAANNAETSVEIFADSKAEYGAVARVMTAIQGAGIEKFAFVMDPEIAD